MMMMMMMMTVVVVVKDCQHRTMMPVSWLSC